METMAQFQQYAEQSLNRHLAELSVKYQDKTIDKNTILAAFKDHRHIFDKELSQKMTSLTKMENDPWISAELEEMKRSFIRRLVMEKLYQQV
jgi:hypothetical protein